MPTLTTNDLRLLTFLYKDCQSYKDYPHIVIAIEDMKPCGLSKKEIITSMDKLRWLNVHNLACHEYQPLFKDYLEWTFTDEYRKKDKLLPSMFFDIELNVSLAKQLLDKYSKTKTKQPPSSQTKKTTT